jgi:hypothetical protein
MGWDRANHDGLLPSKPPYQADLVTRDPHSVPLLPRVATTPTLFPSDLVPTKTGRDDNLISALFPKMHLSLLQAKAFVPWLPVTRPPSV